MFGSIFDLVHGQPSVPLTSRRRILCFILLLLFASLLFIEPAAAGPDGDSFRVRVVNLSPNSVEKQPVEIRLNDLPEPLRSSPVRVRSSNGRLLPSQVDDMNVDGRPDTLLFRVDLAGNAADRVYVEAAPRKQNATGSSLSVNPGERTIRNEHLTWTIGKVVDRQTGETWLSNINQRTGVEGAGDWRVITDGPVRAGLGRAYSGKGFEVRERYTLYAGENTVTVEAVYTNTTGSTQKLPLGSNIPFWRNDSFPEVEQVISPWTYKKTNRTVSLGVNQEGNKGIGVIQHTMAGTGKAQFNKGNGRIQLKRPGLIGRHRFRKWSWSMKPFNVKPGETVRHATSFCFYRNSSRSKLIRTFRKDVDAVPGTVAAYGPDGSLLHMAAAPDYLEDEFAKLDRWTATSELDARATNGTVRLSEPGKSGSFYTHAIRDLRDPTELRVGVDSIDDDTELTVTLTDVDTGTSHTYGPFTGDAAVPLLQEKQSDTDDELGAWWRNFAKKPETFRYTEKEIKRAFDPWDDTDRLRKTFRVSVKLHPRNGGTGPLRAALDRLSLSWFQPEPPQASAPADGSKLPDLALAFTVLSRTIQKVERGYELQVGTDPSFDDVKKEFWIPANIVGGKTVYQKNNLVPDELLEPGTYYWRARSLSITGQPTEWTEPNRFTITEPERETRPPVRSISPRNPLFLTVAEIPEMYDALPDRMKPYFASEPRGPKGSRKKLNSWLNSRGPGSMLLHYKKGLPLATLDHLVRNDGEEKILGFVFGEKGIKNTKSMRRALELGARHGRYVGSLTAFHPEQRLRPGDEDYARFIADHSAYYLPVQKQNNLKLPFLRNLAAIGLYVTGRADQWGAETEWGVGFKPNWSRKYKPYIRSYPVEWMHPFLVGLASGATLYRVEGFRNSHPCYAWRGGRFGPLWTHALRDFVGDVLEQNLIPTRAELRDAMKVAVRTEPATENSPGWREVMAAIYGLDGKRPFRAEWMPNRSRYGIVPPLPAHASKDETAHFDTIIRPSDYDSAEQVLKELDRTYPPEPDGNEAWSVLMGDTGVISNTVDALQNTRSEPFVLELSKGPVKKVHGTVDYHQYLILKQKRNQLFVHANHYARDRTSERKRLKKNRPRQTGEDVTVPMPSTKDHTTTRTTVRFSARKRVKARVSPESALEKQRWNGKRNELTVTVNHKTGVARMFVEEK